MRNHTANAWAWVMVMFLEPITCLAMAIYFEARGEPTIGQMAVAHVIMNRVESDDFPDTVCGVVTEGETYITKPDLPIRHQCQFSFYCDGKSDKPTDEDALHWATSIAWGDYHKQIYDPTNGAVYYHADYVQPDWAETKRPVRQISRHIFYKEN